MNAHAVAGIAMAALVACASHAPVASVPCEQRETPAPAATKQSFATPEAALEEYVAALAANDLDAAIRESAIDDIVTRSDYGARARYIGMLPPINLDAPSKYAMYVRMNRARAIADFAAGTKLFIYGLLTDMNTDEPTTTAATDENVDAFIRAVDPARLKTLKVVRIDPPPLPVGNTAELTAMNKKHAALDGADDKAERYALLSLGRQNYFGAFTLLKFGAAWRLRDFRTILAKNPTTGLVEKTTVEEYEARLK